MAPGLRAAAAPARPGVPRPAVALAATRSPPMRRVEVAWLAAPGRVEEASRLVPALPAFEEAFAAFARGTLFATERGFAAVEDLRPGMQVRVAGGGLRTLLWRGSLFAGGTTPDGLGTGPARLTRVLTDALGIGRPFADLLLGPHARVVRRGPGLRARPGAGAGSRAGAGSQAALVPAAWLAEDGDEGVVALAPASPLEVFHLGFAAHERLEAQGVEVGSQHPFALARQGLPPALLDLWLSCFPHRRSLEEWGRPALPCAPEAGEGLLDAA